MPKNSMAIPVPKAPHPDTLADPHLTIASAEQDKLICFCPRNKCGAVLHVASGLWAIYSPLSFIEFYNTIGERGIELPKGHDYELWMQSVALATQSGNATH
jgi:hypothetical protein